MTRLRLVTWNCRSGTVAKRLADVAELDPHIVFLQECRSADNIPGRLVGVRVGGRKGIALLATDSAFRVAPAALPDNCGRASIAARFVYPVPFTLVGLWAQGPHYVEEVLLTVGGCSRFARRGPVILMGDLNTGSRLGDGSSLTPNHSPVLDACTSLGLVSAYHAFHRLDPGMETHATYFHQFNRSKPWHIDYCFVPRSWAPHLTKVDVVDSRKWASRSDHRPLLVEIETA